MVHRPPSLAALSPPPLHHFFLSVLRPHPPRARAPPLTGRPPLSLSFPLSFSQQMVSSLLLPLPPPPACCPFHRAPLPQPPPLLSLSLPVPLPDPPPASPPPPPPPPPPRLPPPSARRPQVRSPPPPHPPPGAHHHRARVIVENLCLRGVSRCPTTTRRGWRSAICRRPIRRSTPGRPSAPSGANHDGIGR